MKTLIKSLKSRPFYGIKLKSKISKESPLLNTLEGFNKTQDNFFWILVSKDPKIDYCYFVVSIPYWKIIKDNFGEFEKALLALEKNSKEQMQFSVKTTFVYHADKYVPDPELPIAFEAQGHNKQKLILNGVRLTIPDSSEFESIVLDVGRCEDCGQEKLEIHVDSYISGKFGVKLLNESLANTKKFVSNFLRKKDKKDGS